MATNGHAYSVQDLVKTVPQQKVWKIIKKLGVEEIASNPGLFKTQKQNKQLATCFY